MNKIEVLSLFSVFIILLTGCSSKNNIENDLLELGYELNDSTYEMRLDYDTDMFLLVDSEFETITVKTNNAEVLLNKDGSISCSESLGGTCEEAKTTSGIFSLGQQIRVSLQNIKDNASYRNSYINTVKILGFDLTEINEIVNFSS